jgi:ribonuclease HI
MAKKGWWRQLQSGDYPETQLSYGQDMRALKGETPPKESVGVLIPDRRIPSPPIYDPSKVRQPKKRTSNRRFQKNPKDKRVKQKARDPKPMHPELWEPDEHIKNFIKRKIVELGSVDDVKFFYSGDSKICNYARRIAPAILIKAAELKHVVMYARGMCDKEGIGGYGVILTYKNNSRELSGWSKNTTNNRMDLEAVVNGLRVLKETCQVTIFSSNRYVIDPIVKGWINHWEKNDWKNKGVPIKNAELWKKVIEHSEAHVIKFKWLEVSSTTEQLMRCDELARCSIAEAIKHQ